MHVVENIFRYFRFGRKFAKKFLNGGWLGKRHPANALRIEGVPSSTYSHSIAFGSFSEGCAPCLQAAVKANAVITVKGNAFDLRFIGINITIISDV